MKFSSYKFLILSAFVLTLIFLADFNQAEASRLENIRGIASSSAGYISFNCLDDDFFGKFTMVFPFYFNVLPCTVSQHGVNLDDYNNFSGSAWSPSLGYIDFGSMDAPDAPNYAFNTNCLNQCNAANGCHACYNYNTQQAYGWGYYAKEDEWISLDDSAIQPVFMQNINGPQPGTFRGYATTKTLGNISFNCLTDGTCGTNQYKVFMWKLELQSMSAPNWSFSDACNGSAKKVVFKWLKKSGIQTGYRVIVSKTNSTSTPEFDTGRKTSGANQLVCPGADCTWVPDYDTRYYWWLQLWDEVGDETAWFQFDQSINGVLTDNNIYNNTGNPDKKLTFTTYRHEFPNPFFSWSPLDVVVGSTTQFVSDAKFYTNAQPNSNPQTCIDGNCGFLWSASIPADAIIDTPNNANTGIIFKNINRQDVTLTVTDAENYMCSRSYEISTINFQLPLWKEVKAE